MPTKIEWTEETWNPITGCTKVSPGCTHCYAERMARRLAGRYGYPEAPHQFDVTLHEDRLEQPFSWRKPTTGFVCSMGDLFHRDVPDEWIDRVWATMLLCPQHTFQVLTKRAERLPRYLSRIEHDPDFPNTSLRYARVLQAARVIRAKRPDLLRVPISDPAICPGRNIWLGVTAEDQLRADERIPLLLQAPAAIRFVSIEPMLGPVDLRQAHEMAYDHGVPATRRLSWVICGGETGPGARPVHPDWVRDLRDQCVAAGVPFFFKKWGGPQGQGWVIDGKLYSGHLIDGQEWREMPAVPTYRISIPKEEMWAR
jgi:protein gp37